MVTKVAPVSQEKQLWNEHKKAGFFTKLEYLVNRFFMVNLGMANVKSGDHFARIFWEAKDAPKQTPVAGNRVVSEENIRTRALDAFRREQRLDNNS